MVTIKLYLRTSAKTHDYGYVHVLFYLKRKKTHFSTGVQCKLKHWNAKTMRVSSGDTNYKDKNLVIENCLARINNVFVKYRLRNKELSREGFQRSYSRPDDFENFYAYCDEYKKFVSKRVESVTLAIHDTVLNKLKEYSPNLHFDDLTVDFLAGFYLYLRKKLKNNENTAYKNMSVIRKYVNAAYRAGYMDENPFQDFSIIRTRASYTYLEEDEINALINIYKTGNLSINQYKTLQIFLFMCFGSQHIGDAKSMKLEHFNDTSFTYYRIKNRNKKPEPVVVPISQPLRMVLQSIVGLRKQGPIFDNLPSDQRLNLYIKEIAELAGIKKKITLKTGRHTFATYFLSKVTDLNTLKDIMGHSDIRQTLEYAHVLEQTKQRGICCFDSFSI